MENTSDFYYEKLRTTDKPGNIIAAMYCTLYDIPITKSEIIMFNRLIKVFDRFKVFFSVLDAAGTYPDRIENPYPLLYTICKRRFESSHPDSIIQARESLEGMIKDIDRQLEKLVSKKIKIPSSEGL